MRSHDVLTERTVANRRPAHKAGAPRSTFAAYGEQAHAHPRRLDNVNAAAAERLFQRRQIGQQHGGLAFGSPRLLEPEKHDRQFDVLPQGKQSAEIGIGRNDDPIFISSPLENVFVDGGLHPVIRSACSRSG